MKYIGYFLIMVQLLIFSSCAKEQTIKEPNPNEAAIVANSTLANLLQKTALNDGSIDNIIDNANCFSIQLPLSVIVNGQNVLVSSYDDLETIESIFEISNSDVDLLSIVFPVRLIFSDYQSAEVVNLTEFNAFSAQCNGENEVDDDIECLDFKYPIVLSIFNSNTEITQDTTIEGDQELYELIKNLDNNDFASFSFPLVLILADQSEVIVTNLSQLEMVIDGNKNNCDEDDDYDYDDDDIDNTNFSEQEYIDLLISCAWKIDELEVNDNHIENLEDALLTFTSDGNVSALLNNVTTTGTWVVSTDNGLRLNLNMVSLTELNNTWRLNKIEPEDDGKDKMELRIGKDELKLIKNCN